jgi:hypothetical protein
VRSRYATYADEAPDLSRYGAPTDDEQDQPPDDAWMRSGTNPKRWQRYGGGGGSAPMSLPVSKSGGSPGDQADAPDEEPEGGWVGDDQSDVSRGTSPPPGTAARMRLAQAEKDLDDETEKAGGMLGLAFPGLTSRRVAMKNAKVERLRSEVAYEENRRGAEAAAKNAALLERAKIRAAGQEKDAELRRNAKPFSAEGKMWIDRGQGSEPYLKPSTPKEIAGPPVPGASMQATIPGEQFAAEPKEKEGKIHSVAEGYVDEKNVFHRTATKPEKEDPVEKRAATAANTAYSAWLRDHMDDQAGAEQAYSSAYTAARKVGINAREGIAPETPPKRKNYRNNQTGQLEPFVWDDKARKYVPERG